MLVRIKIGFEACLLQAETTNHKDSAISTRTHQHPMIVRAANAASGSLLKKRIIVPKTDHCPNNAGIGPYFTPSFHTDSHINRNLCL